MFEKLRKNLLQLFLIILFLYFFILVFLYFYQRNLLYHPNENNYSGDQISVDIQKVKIQTSDNLELLGWYHEKNLKDYKTLIFFHGNAGSLENRIHKLNHFQDMNINFLIIAWRGFSGNNGKPTEQGLYEDGKSAIHWLVKKGVNEKNLVLYGESLGTGVATHLAQNKIWKFLDFFKNFIYARYFLYKPLFLSSQPLKPLKSSPRGQNLPGLLFTAHSVHRGPVPAQFCGLSCLFV